MIRHFEAAIREDSCLHFPLLISLLSFFATAQDPPLLPFYPFTFFMITSALIRPSFLADTLRQQVIEVTIAHPVPHLVCRVVPSEHPRQILPPSLQPFSHTVSTAQGRQVSLLSYIRPMAVKYPSTSADVSR